MQSGYEAIKTEGAELIAISRDSQAAVASTRQNLNITFLLLSDAELQAISAYNVIDPTSGNIGRPATYIIDGDGKIAWKFLDAKFNTRLDSDRIVSELQKL